MEAAVYRFWTSQCLGYSNRMEDGFFAVWGLGPQLWGICTHSAGMGKMPTLTAMLTLPPMETAVEIIQVGLEERQGDW